MRYGTREKGCSSIVCYSFYNYQCIKISLYNVKIVKILTNQNELSKLYTNLNI